MKLNQKTRIAALLMLALTVLVCVALAACETTDNTTKVLATLPEGTLKLGSKVRVSALAADGSECAIKFDETKYGKIIQVDGMEVTVIGDVKQSTEIELTVYSVDNEKATTTVKITVVPSTDGTIVINSDIGYVLDVGKSATLTLSDNSGKLEVTYSIDGGLTFSTECPYLSYSSRASVLSVVTSPLQDLPVIVKIRDTANGIFGTATFTVKGLVNISLSLEKTSLQKPSETATDKTTGSTTLNVTVSNGAEVEFETSSDMIEVSKVDGKYVVSLVKDVRFDTTATITAKLKDNPNIKKEVTVKLLQTRGNQEPVIGGNTGITLTKESLAQVGNASITATGSLSDITLTVASSKEEKQQYDMLVKMSPDRWYGEWNIKGSKIKTFDTYIKSASTVKITDASGSTTDVNVMDRLYIGIDNKVASKTVKDTDSVPVLWQNQHLWNHLTSSYITVDDFNYESDIDATELGFVSRGTSNTQMAVFKYRYDATNEQTAYLFAYIKQSLTSLLGGDDAIEELYLVADSEGVLGLYAKTYVAEYWGTEDNTPVQGEQPVSKSWSTVAITFSDIGTTVVEDPAPYKNVDSSMFKTFYPYLEEALNDIKESKNYKFIAEDTSTRAPAINEDDYTVSTNAMSGSSAAIATYAATSSNYYNKNSTTGLNGQAATGTMGYVVANRENPFVLLEEVGKYESSMDDKVYHFTYTGYKGFGSGSTAYYEEFAYNYDFDGFVGTRKVNADISTILPVFDFDHNLFVCKGVNEVNGRMVITFELQDPSLTYDVVQQMSLDKQRNSASGDSQKSVQINIAEDPDNKDHYIIVSTSYPYSFAGGTYAGYITTYYYDIGTTSLSEETVFGTNEDGTIKYQQRVLPTSWSQVKHGGDSNLNYYYYLHSTVVKDYPGMYDSDKGEYVKNGDPKLTSSMMDVVINDVFGDNKVYMPGPDFFLALFDDSMSGPWFDFTRTGKDSAGNDVYIDEISFNVDVPNIDDNKVLTNEEYVKIINNIKASFEAWNEAHKTELGLTKDSETGKWNKGWNFSEQNSTSLSDFAYNDVSNRRAVFTCEGLTIVIDNIRTAYFYITVYNAGEWNV